MDITIPPHNLKRFTAAITCLGKIGKDLYVSFDPLDGLILSSLNEAKSAFGKFHFDSTFFDRCSAPAFVTRSSFSRRRNNNNNDDSDDDDEFYDSSRYVCRVPVRSVHSVLRPRKGICSLRIRSEGADDLGNHFGLKNSKKKRKRRQQQRDENDDNDEGSEDEEERRRYSSSSRRRRNKQKNKKNNPDNDDTATSEQGQDKMMLSFEFLIELTNKNINVMEGLNNNNTGGGTFRVTHKVGVTDANGITLSASTRKRDRSEIVAPPKLWLRLLDPLRRTAEVALTIDDKLNVVTATSFHPGEMQGGGSSGDTREDNAVLKAAAEKAAVLKTETSTGTEEFDEYDFRNNRGRKKKRRRRGRRDDDDDTDDDENDSENDDDDDDERQKSDRPPPDVNQKVILVFSIKEAKAMLQFCAQTNSAFHDDGDALSILSFHWGGKPLVIETDGDSFSGELVLATLHHGMIASNILVGGRRESTG